MTNDSLVYVQSCIALAGDNLQSTESILGLEQGETRYGRQTFLYYRVVMGTYQSGNPPQNVRSVVVELNVETPHGPRFVDDGNFKPLPKA